jgi:RNA polymerase sigma factor (sigma-70 family)
MPSKLAITSERVLQTREERLAMLRAVVEDDFTGLHKAVAIVIHKSPGRRTRESVDEIALELLGEAVRRVLERPENYDPTRSAFAWIVGVAIKVLSEKRRGDAKRARMADLSDEAWKAIEGSLGDSAESCASARVDIAEKLALLSPGDRRALECRYGQGLDGEALAVALGVNSQSAARVRVHRARQRLRDMLDPRGEEVIR